MLKQLSEGKLYVPLLQAIDIYTDMGRFTIAAKHHETIAGIFESEVDLFKMHSSLTSPDSNQFSQCADLDKAMQHYEQVAKKFKNLIFPQEEVFSFHCISIIFPPGSRLFQGRRVKQLCKQVYAQGFINQIAKESIAYEISISYKTGA